MKKYFNKGNINAFVIAAICISVIVLEGTITFNNLSLIYRGIRTSGKVIGYERGSVLFKFNTAEKKEIKTSVFHFEAPFFSDPANKESIVYYDKNAPYNAILYNIWQICIFPFSSSLTAAFFLIMVIRIIKARAHD